MPDRTIARLTAAVAIILLAAVSAPRLQLDYLPRVDEPELLAVLRIQGAVADPMEITNRWIVPMESAVRSLGKITAIRTRVSVDGATVQVRMRRGTDVEAKAARLASDLARLRAQLPAGSILSVFPSDQRGSQPAMVVAITGRHAAAQAERVADTIRTARGVRDVQLFGSDERLTDIRLLPGAPETITAPAVVNSVRAGLAPSNLGFVGGSRAQPVVGAPATTRVEDLPIRSGDAILPLRTVAGISTSTSGPDAVARVAGRPATLLSIFRDDEISLFTFERSVTEKIGNLTGLTAEILWSDGRELRAMLGRGAVAAAIASLLLAIVGYMLGGWRGLFLAAYVPLAAALFVNLAGFLSIRVDASTVVTIAIAMAGLAPFAAWRISSPVRPRFVVVAVFFAVMLPIAVTFAGGSIQTILRQSSWSFVAGAVAASLAIALLPTAGRKRLPFARPVRMLLRHSAGMVLAVTAATLFLLSYFGNRLDPRVESAAEPGRLVIRLTLPAGTTLAQTIAALERVEKPLAAAEEIERFWTFAGAGWANTIVEVKAGWRSGPQGGLFRSRLRHSLPFTSGMVSIVDSQDGTTGGSSRDLEERPFTDEDASIYRFLIKGTDARTVQATFEALASDLARREIRRGFVSTGWPPDTPILELRPRATTLPQRARSAAAEIAQQSTPPRVWTLPNGMAARVVPPGGSDSDETIPQRADLFARLYAGSTVAELFDVRTSLMPGGATRELGRFVLPVTVNVPGFGESRIPKREEIDRAIAAMALPAGVTIERPSLAKWTFSRTKLRAFLLAAMLPAMLLAAAAIVLSSMPAAAVGIAVSVTGISFVSPLLMLGGAGVDERTLFATGCAACCTAAVTVALLARIGRRTSTTYRAVRRFAMPAVLASVAAVVMLAILAADDRGARDGWGNPLRAAAVTLLISTAAGALAGPAVVLLQRDLVRRRSRVVKEMAKPATWREGGPAHIEIRSVSKRYRGGFRALRQVSVELTPGVVGLLGPNGAGKTTLLRILTGLLLPTRGQISYRGVPVNETNLSEYRRMIGFLPQEFNAYAGMTAAGFLDYWALERGIEDRVARQRQIEDLLAAVGLEDDANRRVRDFSGGMRQRIGIARALIGDPPLLVVDEPTTGLDLESRLRFRALMKSLARGRIVVLSTHIASDVEATATRLILLSRGTLIWDGTPEALIANAAGRVFETVVSDADARALSRQYRLTYRVRVADGVRVRGVIADRGSLPGAAVEASLEEAYLAAMPGERIVHSGAFRFLYAPS